MSDPKILFVKQFLATLFINGVITIPINNENFKNGIEKMSEYFADNAARFGPHAEKLEMLFLKYSTRGDYAQFSRMIESFNGRVVSLENPYYVKANIKMEQGYVNELVENDELGIQAEEYENLVKCFRQGAEI